MKWMLVAIVLGGHPVETWLIFHSWRECLMAGWEATDARLNGTAELMSVLLAEARADGQDLSEDARAELTARAVNDAAGELEFVCIPHAGN